MSGIVLDVETIVGNKIYKLSGLRGSYASDGSKQTITYIHEMVSGSVIKFSQENSWDNMIEIKIECVL